MGRPSLQYAGDDPLLVNIKPDTIIRFPKTHPLCMRLGARHPAQPSRYLPKYARFSGECALQQCTALRVPPLNRDPWLSAERLSLMVSRMGWLILDERTRFGSGWSTAFREEAGRLASSRCARLTGACDTMFYVERPELSMR